jgi:hypothetical protein
LVARSKTLPRCALAAGRPLGGIDHDKGVVPDLEQNVTEGARAHEALRVDREEPAGIVGRWDETVASTASPAQDESNRK